MSMLRAATLHRPVTKLLSQSTKCLTQARRWRGNGPVENVDSLLEARLKEATIKNSALLNENASLRKQVSLLEQEAKDEKVKVEEKVKELKELQDKYLRALAETENVRQTTRKRVEEAKLYGGQEFAEQIINVADIIEKAKDSIKNNLDTEALVEGMKIMEAEVQKIFKKNGLKKLGSVGESFSPSIHEALFEVPGDEPGTVAVVSRKGYMLHNRTLRPAGVGVTVVKNET